MLEREFSDRTGFYPSADMYEIIESKYLEMDIDKDKDLAECIQMETDKATVIKLNELTKKAKEEKEALEYRIKMLERGMKDLQLLYDKELEWKPYENEKLYSQEEYDKLLGFEDGTTKKWETRTVQLPEQDEMIRNSWDNRYAKKMLEEHKEAFDQARYEKIMEDVKKEDLL